MDAMLAAYIECALWSSVETDEDGNLGDTLDAFYDASDLAPETLATMTEDCADFMEQAKDLAERLGVELPDESQMGHDFWLTRNHHGAGFWDRGNGELGAELTALCRPYGSQDLYVGDDGKIYAS